MGVHTLQGGAVGGGRRGPLCPPLTLPRMGWRLSPAMQDPLLILGLMTLWPGWGSGILTAAELREVGVGDLDSWAKLTGERENCST